MAAASPYLNHRSLLSGGRRHKTSAHSNRPRSPKTRTNPITPTSCSDAIACEEIQGWFGSLGRCARVEPVPRPQMGEEAHSFSARMLEATRPLIDPWVESSEASTGPHG